MSHDLSIAQSALDSINRIDAVCLESAIDVTNALMDNYEKDIEMRIYRSQIVQEGGWLKPDEDEHILKTIFFAIPRFVMHLIRLIKKRWQNMKMAKIEAKKIAEIEEKIAEELKEKENAKKDYEEAKRQNEAAEARADAKNKELASINRFFDGITNLKYNENKKCFEYYSNIKDYADLVEYYKSMEVFFKEYEEKCKDYVGSLDIFSTLHYSGKSYVERNIFSEKNDNIYEFSPEFKDMIDEISSIQEFSVNTINESMKRVNEWYAKAMTANKPKTSVGEAAVIDRIFDDVRKIRDDFTKFDNIVYASLSSAKSTFIQFEKRIEEWNAIENNKTKKDLFDNDDEDNNEE